MKEIIWSKIEATAYYYNIKNQLINQSIYCNQSMESQEGKVKFTDAMKDKRYSSMLKHWFKDVWHDTLYQWLVSPCGVSKDWWLQEFHCIYEAMKANISERPNQEKDCFFENATSVINPTLLYASPQLESTTFNSFKELNQIVCLYLTVTG